MMVAIPPHPEPAPFWAPWHHTTTRTTIQHVAGWTLRIDTDVFSGQPKCRLYRNNIEYQRQALVFRFPRDVDTSTAIYRIDGGAPNWAQSDMVELVSLGFALHYDDLTNSSGGYLRIPLRKIRLAHRIRVEVSTLHPPTTFDIGGVDQAVATARGLGCT